ncbi:hypothetical protein E1287_34660 [Actinomadura sp. KC06]|uniref:hypothetical protein n=1 Tax=Actinomadura sp. KC06 TaxID=2530369 RepID=UPI00104BDA15|nr:hypothetical protein [Actinomadura sp. KC06]TDD27361.1 hypothetical protein E1287_34660 [Actinomadura sp. KC06]
MDTTTITLAAPRTAKSPAFFGIISGDGIIEAAASPARAIRALTGRGFTIGAAPAALKVAAEDGIVTSAAHV